MRVRLMALALGLSLAGLVHAHTAAAQEQDDHTDEAPASDAVAPEGSVGIGDGLFLTGAVITPLDGGPARELDAYQAAVFVQSWLAYAFYGPDGTEQAPAADLAVYRVDLSGSWAGAPGVLTVHYADDGTTPYVAFPGLVIRDFDDPDPRPVEGWFTAPRRVMETFRGEGELEDTLGTSQATATTEPSAGFVPAAGGSGQDGTPWLLWAALPGAGLVVIGWLWFRRRQARVSTAQA